MASGEAGDEAFTFGGADEVRGVLEFDLSGLLPLQRDPDQLVASATLDLDYRALALRFPQDLGGLADAVGLHEVAGNHVLYFVADHYLWRSDGTVVGTVQVSAKDAQQNERIVDPAQLTLVDPDPSSPGDERLYFVVGNTLWRWNPHAATDPPAPVQVAGGRAISGLGSLTAAGGSLCFGAAEATTPKL